MFTVASCARIMRVGSGIVHSLSMRTNDHIVGSHGICSGVALNDVPMRLFVGITLPYSLQDWYGYPEEISKHSQSQQLQKHSEFRVAVERYMVYIRHHWVLLLLDQNPYATWSHRPSPAKLSMGVSVNSSHETDHTIPFNMQLSLPKTYPKSSSESYHNQQNHTDHRLPILKFIGCSWYISDFGPIFVMLQLSHITDGANFGLWKVRLCLGWVISWSLEAQAQCDTLERICSWLTGS